MAYYERLPIGHEERNYRYLVTLVKRYLENRRRNQLRDEASRNVGKAAYVAEDAPRQKGDCYRWLELGKCASGRDCPYLHDKEKKVADDLLALEDQKLDRPGDPRREAEAPGPIRIRCAVARPHRGPRPARI